MVVAWESVVALLNASVDAREFFDALARDPGTLPETARPILSHLASLCHGTDAKIAIATVLRDVLPDTARRHQSGFFAAAPQCSDPSLGLRAYPAVPDVIQVSAPMGRRAIAIPDCKRGTWVRLRWGIETAIVESLLRANGRPVPLTELPELCRSERSVTNVVGRINDQFPGGRSRRIIETYGEAPRRRGQHRKADSAQEQPDRRMFLIHSSWRVATVSLGSLDDIEDEENAEPELVRLFGRPGHARG